MKYIFSRCDKGSVSLHQTGYWSWNGYSYFFLIFNRRLMQLGDMSEKSYACLARPVDVVHGYINTFCQHLLVTAIQRVLKFSCTPSDFGFEAILVI